MLTFSQAYSSFLILKNGFVCQQAASCVHTALNFECESVANCLLPPTTVSGCSPDVRWLVDALNAPALHMDNVGPEGSSVVFYVAGFTDRGISRTTYRGHYRSKCTQ